MQANSEKYRPQRRTALLAAVLWIVLAQLVQAVTVNPGEMAETRSWVSAKFEGVSPVPPLDPGLEVVVNYDAVQKDARFGKPLKIVDTQFRHGLFCHATSKIVVRLPGPGKAFQAIVGVDSNEQTSGGRGSVVFSVEVGGKEAFSSGLLREGTPGLPVAIDLAGATQFILQVTDADDGISCDQADWADAKISLADGREIWLADLPMAGGPAIADAQTPFFSFTYGGLASFELLKNWPLVRTSRRLDEYRIERTLTYTDLKTGLLVRCVGVEYTDFPTVEWTLYFKNTGTTNTPILENIQALDAGFARALRGVPAAPCGGQPLRGE